MKLHFGEKVTPKPVSHENDADNIWGPAWHAQRRDGGFVLEYQSGDLAGTEAQVPISREEFERLRADPAAFDEVVIAHGG